MMTAESDERMRFTVRPPSATAPQELINSLELNRPHWETDTSAGAGQTTFVFTFLSSYELAEYKTNIISEAKMKLINF